MGPIPTTHEMLELDLDVRLSWLWMQAWAVGEWDEAIVASFLRMAYFTGYSEALTESRRGTLYRAHSQPVPARKKG